MVKAFKSCKNDSKSCTRGPGLAKLATGPWATDPLATEKFWIFRPSRWKLQI